MCYFVSLCLAVSASAVDYLTTAVSKMTYLCQIGCRTLVTKLNDDDELLNGMLCNAGMKVPQLPGSDQNTSVLVSAGPRQEQQPSGDHAAFHHIDNGDDDGLAFPPPPPAQLLNLADIAGADSDDEFPLPPPPDQEMPTPPTCAAVWPIESASRYPSLIHSASVKLPERGSVLMRLGPPVAAKHHHRMTVADHQQSLAYAAAAAVNRSTLSDTNLLSQIQHGISLRRTVSNDRSAPLIHGKR